MSADISKPKDTVFLVVDDKFNKENNNNLIGLHFEKSPSYIPVKVVDRPVNQIVYKNYSDYVMKQFS